MATRPAPTKSKTRQTVGKLILLIAAALLLYVALPQIGGLKGSWAALGSANIGLLGPALLLLLFTFFLPAVSYRLLALHSLPFVPTFWVQVASGLVGKILPAGLGALGLNALYLTKNKHRPAEAIVVIGMHNTIAFCCFAGLSLATALGLGQSVAWPQVRLVYVLTALAVVAIGLGAAIAVWKKKLSEWLGTLLQGFRHYGQHPWKVVLAVGPNALLPGMFSLLLYCSALALGVHLTLLQAAAAFVAGQSVGTITPTPGGLIGTEAGITAALVGFGFPAAQALSVALLYRLVTYWAPIVLGAGALGVVRKRYL